MKLKNQAHINQLLKDIDQYEPEDLWRKISQQYLHRSDSIEDQQELLRIIYKNTQQEILPVWSPNQQEKWNSNIGQLIKEMNFKTQEELNEWSARNHQDYIAHMINIIGINFNTSFTSILNPDSKPESPEWFPDAKFNIVDSCFPHDKSKNAIVFGDHQHIQSWTYQDLQTKVSEIQAGLKAANIKAGERIGIVMPMSPEAIAIYLAVIAYGCSAVTVAESFTSKELKVRFDITQPSLIFTQDRIVRSGQRHDLYPKVNSSSTSPCIVISTDSDAPIQLQPSDSGWEEFLKPAQVYKSQASTAHDEINVLFSSGTTGTPKAIPWNHTTAIKSAIDGYLHQDITSNDTVCWPTSLGWMMGPWLVFATLINKACIALYNDAPTQTQFGQFIEKSQTSILGLVPSIVKAWSQSKCMESYNWDSIKCFSSTGECSNPGDMFYLMSLAGYKPIIEYCGGTEIGGAYISSTLFKPNAPGFFNSATIGTKWSLFDENHNESQMGEVFIQSPCLGLSTKLINADHTKTYYTNTPKSNSNYKWRKHGDLIEALPNGYFKAHGRADDTMNLGGIKVSAIQLESEILKINEINEVAAIAVPPIEGGPSKLILFIITHQEFSKTDLQPLCQNRLKEINPLYKIHDICFIDSLPRTASNKVMRRTLRDQYLLSNS